MKRTKLLYKGYKRTDIKRCDIRILKRMKFRRLLIFLWVGLVLGIFIKFEQNGTEDIGSRLYLLIGFTGIYLLFLPVFLGLSNIETDVVYTHGIKKKGFFLFDNIIGKTFIPYHRIEKIGYGKGSFPVPALFGFVPFVTRKKQSEFLVIYQKGKDEIHSFLEIEYSDMKTDFYSRLLETLEEKCPDVPWLEMKWEDWRRAPAPIRKSRFSAPSRRKKRVRFCPFCEGRLAYVPEYERWYCYNCQEYAPEE